MHLLDRVAGSKSSMLLTAADGRGASFEVTAASRFASVVAACPLRFVLGDDLTRASADLAFADGERLVGCLDLLRIPASSLWVEWNDEVHKRVVYETQSAESYDAASAGRRVGVLLRGSDDGLAATARTFWADAGDAAEVTLSPLETLIDLRGGFTEVCDIPAILAGGLAGVTDTADEAMSSLLGHVRFRFDDSWAAYYRAFAADSDARSRVVHDSVAAVARDTPLLLAFFLLLSAKDATRSLPISRRAINRKRQALGRGSLLDHIEVHASLEAMAPADSSVFVEPSGRHSPRLHHVRGHLVRRGDRVFWRVPHLRGSASRGMLRSRTVCLAFARQGPRGLSSSHAAI